MHLNFATFSPKFREQGPINIKFKRNLSSTDILALKTQIETIFKVNFSYSGLEFDYEVVLVGSVNETTKATTFIFPKGRSDILIEHSLM